MENKVILSFSSGANGIKLEKKKEKEKEAYKFYIQCGIVRTFFYGEKTPFRTETISIFEK